MDTSQRGIDFIVSWEGKEVLLPDGRYKSYLDTIAQPPVYTVYCGLTRGVNKGTIITKEEGDKMLAKELAVAEDAIERSVRVPLNQNQFDALVSFTYNCGVGAFKSSTLLDRLNQGRYEEIPVQLMRWVHAGGVRIQGLVNRRQAEASLFMEPVQERVEIPTDDEVEGVPAPKMPQRVEPGPVATTKETVSKSWTIRGALLAFFAFLSDTFVDAYNWISSVLLDAGSELGTIKQTVGPFDAVLFSMKTALPFIGAIGIAIVIARRLSAAREGRVG